MVKYAATSSFFRLTNDRILPYDNEVMLPTPAQSATRKPITGRDNVVRSVSSNGK